MSLGECKEFSTKACLYYRKTYLRREKGEVSLWAVILGATAASGSSTNRTLNHVVSQLVALASS